jgi:hypothetical protein
MGRPLSMPEADKFPHGVRARYTSGCRCEECRAANRVYARKRAKENQRGNGNGLVDAEIVRKHLLRLSYRGIGKRAVHDASDVSLTSIEKVRSGKRKTIRAYTAKKLLSIDSRAVSDGANVSAGRTWQYLNWMLKKGYTKSEIAERLGTKSNLQISRYSVRAKTAQKVRRLYRELKEEVEREKNFVPICTQCGYSHRKRDRLKVIKKYLPCKADVVRRAWPCFYGQGPFDDPSLDRALYRDLNDLGAKPDKYQVWHLR